MQSKLHTLRARAARVLLFVIHVSTSIAGLIPLRRRHQKAPNIVFETVRGSLFSRAPAATDARQGAILDCYLISALSCCATHTPRLLRSMCCENRDGSVSVRFYRATEAGEFREEVVTVDRRVPKRAGRILYARASDRGQLWPLIIEKAFAAWRGGYDVIGEGGMSAYVIECLTGVAATKLAIEKKHSEALWQLCRGASRGQRLLAACTHCRRMRPRIDTLGFHPNHMLTILGAATERRNRVVHLRDPFDAPAHGALVKPDAHGVFTLAWRDFLDYFSEVHVSCDAGIHAKGC